LGLPCTGHRLLRSEGVREGWGEGERERERSRERDRDQCPCSVNSIKQSRQGHVCKSLSNHQIKRYCRILRSTYEPADAVQILGSMHASCPAGITSSAPDAMSRMSGFISSRDLTVVPNLCARVPSRTSCLVRYTGPSLITVFFQRFHGLSVELHPTTPEAAKDA